MTVEAKDNLTSEETEDILFRKFGIKVDLKVLNEKGYFRGTREEMAKKRIAL